MELKQVLITISLSIHGSVNLLAKHLQQFPYLEIYPHKSKVGQTILKWFLEISTIIIIAP